MPQPKVLAATTSGGVLRLPDEHFLNQCSLGIRQEMFLAILVAFAGFHETGFQSLAVFD
jgi:hypothetical protein